MQTNLAGRKVRAAAPDDLARHTYLVVADARLLRVVAGSTRAEVVAEVPNIREVGDAGGDGRLQGRELEVGLYVHGRWACVTERFGVNAALVDTATGAVRELSRESYHSNVSSYSVGFLDRDGRTLLIAQTRWNRLDVLDVETGENLTVRAAGPDDQQDGDVDIDYFHSLLHVSPDSRHFLSNGWAWSPVDFVQIFSTEAFLAGYEPTGIAVSTGFGYNWDRPCAFVDDRTFVLALDEDDDEDDEDDDGSPYRQLAFFTIPDPLRADDAARLLEPTSLVDCDVFPRNRDGEVKGQLHYDPRSRCLVALAAGAGCFLVSLDGEVRAHLPDLHVAGPPSHGDFGSSYTGSGGWSYAPLHRTFHRWVEGTGIEERALP